MKIAFLFAGQGSQKVGMGKDIYDHFPLCKELMDQNPEVRDLCFIGPSEDLNQTKYAQPAMLLESYAIAEVLKEHGIIPSMVAGLSLGEYAALTCAGVWDINTAIDIITRRGEIMQDALPLHTSGMAAVIGMDADKIQEVISKMDGVCEIANYNCPGQIVISGDMKCIEEACTTLKEVGARRVIPLNVSGAFHSSLLNEASVLLRQKLNEYTPQKPKYEVVYNVYGTPSDDDINTILERQIKSSVYFMQSISYMIAQGVDTFIEIGAGTALSGFVKKIQPDAKIYNTNTLADVLHVLEEVK